MILFLQDGCVQWAVQSLPERPFNLRHVSTLNSCSLQQPTSCTAVHLKTLSPTADKIWRAASSTGNPNWGEMGRENLAQEAVCSLLEQSNALQAFGSSGLLRCFWGSSGSCCGGVFWLFKDYGWKYNIMQAFYGAYPTWFGIWAQC